MRIAKIVSEPNKGIVKPELPVGYATAQRQTPWIIAYTITASKYEIAFMVIFRTEIKFGLQIAEKHPIY